MLNDVQVWLSISTCDATTRRLRSTSPCCSAMGRALQPFPLPFSAHVKYLQGVIQVEPGTKRLKLSCNRRKSSKALQGLHISTDCLLIVHQYASVAAAARLHISTDCLLIVHQYTSAAAAALRVAARGLTSVSFAAGTLTRLSLKPLEVFLLKPWKLPSNFLSWHS